MKMANQFARLFTLGLVSLLAPSQMLAAKDLLRAELLKDWLALKETMHKIAAEMPADKYNFRPTTGQQTFGERMVHVAVINVALLNALGGAALPKPTIDSNGTAKAAAIKALDDSFDYGTALLEAQTGPTLLQPAAAPPKFLGTSSRARIIAFLVGHTWDIYGQAVVYLRLNSHVPPASQRM
jgi:uncharacterized damage-inducible protein DinB